ncbi:MULTISPECIES: hypothetical protein [unclassified Sphingomonas]|uniref:hypothetical protein n=1 Tax=unclassified Sphingomonas TaxID=196159 RepID=UPI0006F50166|nr:MULTISPECIES: hypothetical protein [unclassified Sphingomonas]KQM98858.1 hypothetical protein ASE78_06480 [Sphingomonas sp. Leaf25]KQN40477.1 hypothetical protein ASE97_01370 [Sphingomonas sp. Leaf42]KQT29831.1 hypothetical protein ASG37_01345 [Sphingomonas sp. Leaf407]
MSRRNLRWRAAGVVLLAIAGTVAVVGYGATATLVALPAALLGLPLALHGKRVAQAIRACRHGHATTAAIVHAAHRRRLWRPAGPSRTDRSMP